MEASGRSKTRKAAKLAVYEATMIIANPAHTIPNTRALKLRGVPVINEFNVYCYLIFSYEEYRYAGNLAEIP